MLGENRSTRNFDSERLQKAQTKSQKMGGDEKNVTSTGRAGWKHDV